MPEEGPESALEASAGSPLNTEGRHDFDIRGPEEAGLLNPYEVVGKPHFLGNPQGDALSGKHDVTIIHGRFATLDESRVARGSPPSQAPYDHVPLVAHSFQLGLGLAADLEFQFTLAHTQSPHGVSFSETVRSLYPTTV